MKKQCFKCGRILDIEEFYPHKETKDGHLNKCKECTKRDVFIRSRACPEKLKEYEIKRSKTEKRKKLCARVTKEYRLKHPERMAIYLKVRRAIKKGIIKKPNNCSLCGKEARLEAHHYDYNKPLDVVFLCCSCHRRLHQGTLNKTI